MRKRSAAYSGFAIAVGVSMDTTTIQNIVKPGLSREHLGLISVRVQDWSLEEQLKHIIVDWNA
jgi:hypothetical protein